MASGVFRDLIAVGLLVLVAAASWIGNYFDFFFRVFAAFRAFFLGTVFDDHDSDLFGLAAAVAGGLWSGRGGGGGWWCDCVSAWLGGGRRWVWIQRVQEGQESDVVLSDWINRFGWRWSSSWC